MVDEIENGYHDGVIGDLNGWIGNRTGEGAKSVRGLSGEMPDHIVLISKFKIVGGCLKSWL